MGQKFTITESERNQIRGLYEQQVQPTDDTIMGNPITKLGLNPAQVLKDTTGNVIGKFYAGVGGNKGYTVKIMNNSNEAIVFDPTVKGSKTMSLQQVVTDFKTRGRDYALSISKGGNPQPEKTFMSDDDVAKLNSAITQTPH